MDFYYYELKYSICYVLGTITTYKNGAYWLLLAFYFQILALYAETLNTVSQVILVSKVSTYKLLYYYIFFLYLVIQLANTRFF